MADIDVEYKDILAIEWSIGFEKLVRDKLTDNEIDEKFFERCKWAMIQSYYKYGRIKQNHGEINCMDAIANLYKRIEKYLSTRNTEFLCDVYNFAMIEYMSPQPVSGVGVKYVYNHKNDIPEDSNLQLLCNTISMYEELRKYTYLHQAAALAVKEYLSPSIPDTYYKGTDSDQAELIGFGVNQLKEY